MPNNASITTTCQISTSPVMISAASAAWRTKRTRSVTTISRWRGTRSAQIPPISMNADERDRVGREDEAEVGRVAGQVDHEQGKGDGDDPVAEHAREPGQPEQPEVAVTQY